MDIVTSGNLDDYEKEFDKCMKHKTINNFWMALYCSLSRRLHISESQLLWIVCKEILLCLYSAYCLATGI